MEVLNRFFEKWAAEAVTWHTDTRATYQAEKAALRGESLNKRMAHLQRWIDRVGKGTINLWSLPTSYIEEQVRKDMAHKKARLLAKIGDQVGDITGVNLHNGDDGTPNGSVTGTKGTVYITTIYAGGYNIQCLHYRVLVHAN